MFEGEIPVRLAGEERVGAPGTAEYGRKRDVTEQSWVCVHQPPGTPHHRRHHTHSCRGTGEPNVRESKHLQVKRHHHHHHREAVSLRPAIDPFTQECVCSSLSASQPTNSAGNIPAHILTSSSQSGECLTHTVWGIYSSISNILS